MRTKLTQFALAFALTASAFAQEKKDDPHCWISTETVNDALALVGGQLALHET